MEKIQSNTQVEVVGLKLSQRSSFNSHLLIVRLLLAFQLGIYIFGASASLPQKQKGAYIVVSESPNKTTYSFLHLFVYSFICSLTASQTSHPAALEAHLLPDLIGV